MLYKLIESWRRNLVGYLLKMEKYTLRLRPQPPRDLFRIHFLNRGTVPCTRGPPNFQGPPPCV